MAFYGESYRIIWATNITGSAVTRAAIQNHWNDAPGEESSTVTAGDSFMVLGEADPNVPADLAAYTDVKVSWVVETGPASAGTIACTSGLDPTYNGEDPAYATQPCGLQSATGAQTLVFPQTVITHAELVAATNGLVALFQCTSGTVEVLQVKLRVWPTAGPGGAWTAGPSYTVTRLPQRRSTFVSYTSDHFADPADAWSDARAGIDDMVGSDVLWGGTNLPARGLFTVAGDPGSLEGYQGQAIFQTNIVFAPERRANWFEAPISGGIDPREHRREVTATIRPAGDSSGTVPEVWTGWTSGSVINAAAGLRVGIDALPGTPSFPGNLAPFIIPTGGVISTGDGIVPPASSAFAFVVIPENYLSFHGVASDSGDAVPSDTFTYTATVSGYEFYDPEAVPAPELSPRFFVKHRDDTMRPVGFGKPATELTVFRTLVHGGWCRDLTTAEYATYGPGVRPPGGYPLSVKRVTDGGDYWWDQVAWLVPE